MRWRNRRQSRNVDDRRNQSPRRPMIAGAGGGLGTIIIVLIVLFMGGDPAELLRVLQNNQAAIPAGGQVQQANNPQEDELAAFVGVVLRDTEEVWHDLFAEMGERYQEPQLVLFRGQVQSACGFASSAMGPFYCPGDSNVYIDLQFYDEMKQKFQAPGDFAQAYVIAHEVGHHVQHLLRISDKVQQKKQQVDKIAGNRLSVRLELQADFLAGVWAYHAQQRFKMLEPGDIEEALTAASAIGDDRLQQQSRGHVVPESFTHGTSAQRVRWFRKGFNSGQVGGATQLFELPYDRL